jgi:hypothetical protein
VLLVQRGYEWEDDFGDERSTMTATAQHAVRLGVTELEVSPIAFGTWQYEVLAEETEAK